MKYTAFFLINTILSFLLALYCSISNGIIMIEYSKEYFTGHSSECILLIIFLIVHLFFLWFLIVSNKLLFTQNHKVSKHLLLFIILNSVAVSWLIIVTILIMIRNAETYRTIFSTELSEYMINNFKLQRIGYIILNSLIIACSVVNYLTFIFPAVKKYKSLKLSNNSTTISRESK